MFVVPSSRNYWTDLVEILNGDRLYTGLVHSLLFISEMSMAPVGGAIGNSE